MNTEQRGGPWFGARRYGFGWTPRGSSGWWIIASYLALSVAGANFFARRDDAADLIAFELALTVALVLICTASGDPPRWRWGGR